MLYTRFQKLIKEWYQCNKRDLPWRRSTDPYVIWLSEIILQQTRVQQGLPYFKKFRKNYPTVEDFARADESRILKDWEGLGYYSRARNMHVAAKSIVKDFGGEFPSEYTEIRSLKGVGEYTAAAIASFAFEKPHAVLDGNVFRVLSRVFGMDTPINSTKGKKEFAALAEEMLDKEDPGNYNQSIMEFGALQCVPQNPDCQNCPLREDCHAFIEDRVKRLPVKVKKKDSRHRFFTFLEVNCSGELILEKRTGKDVWRNLNQFPLIEAPGLLAPDRVLHEMDISGDEPVGILGVADLPQHKLSHQNLHIRVVRVSIKQKDFFRLSKHQQWIRRQHLHNFALPRPLRKYVDGKQLTLHLD